MSDEVRPWDLINGEKSPEDLAEYRLNVCKACEFYRERTNQCKKCGCFMKLKTTLAKAKCPINKW